MSAVETLKKIQESVEMIKSDQTQRFPEAASNGDCFRQGDVYLTFCETIPSGFIKSKQVQLQLAPGTTKGSRHCLDSGKGVLMYEAKNGDALQGPIIKTTKERTVTHPEHGNVILPPGIYNITYQRAYAEELRRVAD
jgi:hypothetical protein